MRSAIHLLGSPPHRKSRGRQVDGRGHTWSLKRQARPCAARRRMPDRMAEPRCAASSTGQMICDWPGHALEEHPANRAGKSQVCTTGKNLGHDLEGRTTSSIGAGSLQGRVTTATPVGFRDGSRARSPREPSVDTARRGRVNTNETLSGWKFGVALTRPYFVIDLMGMVDRRG